MVTPLTHVKGYAAPETRAAAERANLLIEQAEALGKPPDDPLLVFSLLYSFWVSNFVQFNGEVVRSFADQLLKRARKQKTAALLLMAHRVNGFLIVHDGGDKKGTSSPG